MRDVMEGSGALDPASLDRLRATLGTDASFQGILRDFLESSGKLDSELRLSLATGQRRDTERAAHTLKSMARLLGAADLAESCRRLEALAHDRPSPPIPPALVDETVGRLGAVRRAVERLLR